MLNVRRRRTMHQFAIDSPGELRENALRRSRPTTETQRHGEQPVIRKGKTLPLINTDEELIHREGRRGRKFTIEH
jgi:DUF971 family protein